MYESFHNANKRWSYLLISIFAVLLLFWFLINYGAFQSDPNRQIWAAIYQIIAFTGGILGLYYSKLWGGYKSYVGRGILFLSIGLLLQCFGQTVYSYFIFYQHIAVPYPSLGDLGFFGSVIMYIGATAQLARACGVSTKVKHSLRSYFLFVIPIILLDITYVMFLKDYAFDWTNPIKIFLDFGYPLGEAAYVSIALASLLFSKDLLGGIMLKPILFMIVAFLIQYASDFTFLYQSSNGTWSAGGMNDLMYAISYLFMSLAIVYIGKTYLKIQES